MNSNNRTVIYVAIAITIVISLLLIVPGLKRSAEARGIKKQFDALNITAPLKSVDCNSGDGIDSRAQCRYVYSASGATIETALKNAGYTTESTGQLKIYSGGNPALNVYMNSYNGTVTMDISRRT